MSDWVAHLLPQLEAGQPVVRMAVAAVKGSAPREPGATMLFWRDAGGRACARGSIGGGHLEARALEIALHLLAPGSAPRHAERFVLGASLGQCCGGAVELYWERYDRPDQAPALDASALAAGRLRYCALDGSGRDWLCDLDGWGAAGLPAPPAAVAGFVLQAGLRYFVERLQDTRTPLWLYGAGHVGRALVRVLAELPFRITWVDSREDYLEDAMAQLAVAEQVEAQWTDDPAGMAAAAPAGAWHLVMTHSHAQDLDICAAVLARNHFGFAGLIGSRSKAARFRQRLSERGVPAAALARLVCPIGVAGIKSKLPTAVAVAAAAQLLQLREQHALAANEIAYGAMSR